VPVDFILIEEQNNSHGQLFISEVRICDEAYGKGEGFSKRESQQKAAKATLEKLTPNDWKLFKEKIQASTEQK
jgi:ribonuclease-3